MRWPSFILAIVLIIAISPVASGQTGSDEGPVGDAFRAGNTEGCINDRFGLHLHHF